MICRSALLPNPAKELCCSTTPPTGTLLPPKLCAVVVVVLFSPYLQVRFRFVYSHHHLYAVTARASLACAPLLRCHHAAAPKFAADPERLSTQADTGTIGRNAGAGLCRFTAGSEAHP